MIIQTKNNFDVKISLEDLPLISTMKWTAVKSGNTYYAVSNVRKFPGKRGYRAVMMHRVLLNAPSEFDVDHIDGDGLNNSRTNLRLCTKSENHRNERKRRGCSSLYKGVHFHRETKKWLARITLQPGNRIYLGLFKTEIEAAQAYDVAAKRFFREFARLNFSSNEERV